MHENLKIFYFLGPLAPQISQSGPSISSQSSRLSSHTNGNDSLRDSLNRQTSSLTGMSFNISNNTVQNPSVYTTAVMNNFNSASTSASILNGHSLETHRSMNSNETCSVLGAIAGLNSNQFESLVIGNSTQSDNESLTSSMTDDSQFKGSIKNNKNRTSVALSTYSNLTVPVVGNLFIYFYLYIKLSYATYSADDEK